MNNKEPPKPATILATPINVEESRAQRLQRSQARFRDRGGIFVPTSRNTLVDILLGKASPLKKPRRSVSGSPSRNLKGRRKLATAASNEPDTNANNATSRRSPRKQGRKSMQAIRDTEQVAGPSNLDCGNKSVKNSSVARGSKKGASKPRSKPLKGKKVAQQDSDAEGAFFDVDSAPPKRASKTTNARSSKGSSKPSKRPSEDEDENDGIASPIPLTKTSMTKGKSKSKATKTEGIDHEPLRSNASKPSVSMAKASPSTSSAGPNQSARSQRRKSSSDLYSGASEDEYIPPQPTKKAAAQKNKEKQAATSKGKSSSSSKSSSKAAARPTCSKPGATQLEDIPEEDEDISADETSAKPLSAKGTSKEKASTFKETISTASKKRGAEDAGLDPEPAQPKHKRAKASRTEAKGKVKKDLEPEAAPSGKASKKRPRNADNDDDADTGNPSTKEGKATKRKKLDQDSEESRKSSKKPSTTKTKQASDSKAKPPSRKPTKTAKRKENSVIPEQPKQQPEIVKMAPQRGPPKSVLLRIKNSRVQDVLDNEPDPIDFLS